MERKLIILTTIFVTCLIISNVIASKLVMVWGVIVPAAVFVFPITFLMTDTINEVWGKKTAQFTVWLGFGASILLVGYLTLAQYLPYAPFWEDQASFVAILGAVPRIVIASMAAYLISQLHDVWSFNFWKSKTGGKHLWLRNNLSTMTSQLMDSAIFITVAFWGTVPNTVILTMVVSQYIVKLIVAAMDTPLVYVLVRWVRGVNHAHRISGLW